MEGHVGTHALGIITGERTKLAIFNAEGHVGRQDAGPPPTADAFAPAAPSGPSSGRCNGPFCPQVATQDINNANKTQRTAGRPYPMNG